MSKIINQKSKNYISEDDEDSELIINNDEFCAENEQKMNSKKYQKKKKENEIKAKNIKAKDLKLNINSDNNQNRVLTDENQSGQKNPHLDSNNTNTYENSNILVYNNETNNDQKILSIDNTNNLINNYNDEKTIFSKITEDLYVDNLTNLKPRKNLFDFSRRKEDNYNKLTVENYLFNCADKENSKNNKIITEFIERKTKEQECKKIGIDLEKIGKTSQFDNFKRLSYDHKKIKRSKNTRSPEQFIGDQKVLEEKHKNYIKSLIKKHEDEINLLLKDRPTINKNSERISNMNKENNKSVYLKLYEEFNIKKKNKEEKDKININMNFIGNQKLNKETILENAKRLYQEYEKKKKTINENEIKQLKDIKNLSTISLVNKNSNNIISKKLINLYKKELKSIFDKNISDEFDINFSDYLFFIYKLGLTEKNYNQLIKQNKNNKNIINNVENNYAINEMNKNKDNNLESNGISSPKYNDEEKENIKDKIQTSRRNIKKQTNLKSRSVCKKNFESDLEIKLAKDSWKIITNNKIFSDESLGSSYQVLLFFLCLCRIYINEINTCFIKKEFPFLLKNNSNLIDGNLAKHIYKYYSNFRNSLINNINKNTKTIKKIGLMKEIELKNMNLAKISKSFVKNNKSNKNNIFENDKNIPLSNCNLVSKSCKKIKNNLNINTTLTNNEPKMEKKKFIKQNIKNYLINRTKNACSARYNNKTTNEDNIENNLNNLLEQKIRKIKIKKKSNSKKIKNNNGYNTDIKKNQKLVKINKININNKLYEIKNKNNEEIKNKDKHQKEKKSSISNYIFNEECRIKDDIESNSNFNNFDENENDMCKNVSENFEEYNSYNENSINGSHLNINKTPIKADESSSKISNNANNLKKKKNKYIFKIKTKDEMIKLVINKDEDIELKINNFCKENNLDEEEKNQILEAVNLKLKE